MEHKFKNACDIFETPDNKFLIVLYASRIDIFNFANMNKVCEFKNIKHPAYIAFSPDGNVFAVKNTSGNIAVFSLETLTCITKNKLTGKEGHNIFFNKDGKHIICCDWEGNIHTFNYIDGNFIIHKTVKREDFGILNHIHNLDNYYYFIFKKGFLKWEFPFSKHQPDETLFNPRNAFNDISMFRYCKDNKKIAIDKKFERRILIYDEIDGNASKQISLHNSVRDLNWSKDGKYILIACSSTNGITLPIVRLKNIIEYTVPKNIGNVFIMRVDDGQIVKDFSVDYVIRTKFSKDMKHVFISNYKECVSFEIEDLNL